MYEIKSRGANVDINSLKKLEDNINQEKVNEGSITFSEDGTYMIFAKEMTERAQEEIMWIYTGPDLEEEAGPIQDF